MNLKNSTAPAIPTKGMPRQEWLEARRSGIGGSDIAALMGVSEYNNAYDIYKSKVNPVLETKEENEAAEWGHLQEPIIAKQFELKTGLKTQNINFIMRHPDTSFAIANIDRAIVNPEIAGNVRFKDGRLTTDEILEVKTASEYLASDWGDEDTDEVPDQYQCQGQWYLYVTNAKRCYIAVLIGGNKFRRYVVERNDDLIEVLVDVARTFWEDHVLAGVAPEPITLENAKDRWRKCNPDTTLDLSSSDIEAIALLARYKKLKRLSKKVEEATDEAQKNLICLIKANETLRIDEKVVVTYKASETNRLDSKEFKKDYPDLAKQYIKTTTGRTMRVKK